MKYEQLGRWSFLLGAVIAVVAGLAWTALGPVAPVVSLLLVILGLIVGFLNVGDKEIKDFLIAAIALLVTQNAFWVIAEKSTTLGVLSNLFIFLDLMVSNLAAFVAPAALVVALKAVYNLASRPS